MTEGAASASGSSASQPLFRCKVLKPPRSPVPSSERLVIHPPISVVAGVLRRDDGRILITQRLADDTLGGYWEFPGGKVEPNEELVPALQRELREELGIEAEVGAEIHCIVHAYPDRDVKLHFYDARIVSGEPQKLEVADFRWVTLDELMLYQFPEADLPLLKQLRGVSLTSTPLANPAFLSNQTRSSFEADRVAAKVAA